MSTFEMNCNCEDINTNSTDARTSSTSNTNNRGLKEECIVALKVYDQCRQQSCLTDGIIGPARAAVTTTACGERINEGEIINPPCEAANVTIEDLKLKKIIIVSKEPNPFKNGFWDIDLKYVFLYKLVFREANGDIICCVCANSIYTKRVTLFGSLGTDIMIASDLLGPVGDTLEADPILIAEGKAVALSAEIRCAQRRCGCADTPEAGREVVVTIGLFTVIKLCRLVDLSVQSTGFCIPEECENNSPLSPCEFFDTLDFPFEVFSPPQKAEFFANSSNTNNNTCIRRPCGCKC